MPGLQLRGLRVLFVFPCFSLGIGLGPVSEDPSAAATSGPHAGDGEAFDEFAVVLHERMFA